MPSESKSENNIVEVYVYYIEEKNKRGIKNFKIIEELSDRNSNKIKSIKFIWKMPSWEVESSIFKDCLIINPSTHEKDIDINILDELQIRNCLLDWDLSNKEGEKIPLTKENINNMPREIIREAIRKYRDSATESPDNIEKIFSSLVDILNGKWSGEDESLHMVIIEFLFASHYGWSLEYINSLSAKVIKNHLRCILVREKINSRKM